MARWLEEVSEVCPPEDLKLRRAAELVAFIVAHGGEHGVRLVEARRQGESFEVLIIEVDVERPQVRAFDIKRREQIAIVVQEDDRFLSVFSNRDDFPFTPHQNGVPEGVSASLCVDDRPWPEAKLTWTPADCIRRIREWLAKAARGELNDPSQPLEPFFYSASATLVIPRSAMMATGSGEPVRLLGHVKGEGTAPVIIARPVDGAFKDKDVNGRIAVIPLVLPLQEMRGIHGLPKTLGALAAFLRLFDLDLLAELRKRIVAWVDWKGPNFDFLSARIAISVVGGVAEASRTALSARAFMTSSMLAGDVGVAIGCLHAVRPSEGGGVKQYVAALPADTAKTGGDVRIEPMNIHVDFDRNLAAHVSGNDAPDERNVVLVGAGAIGSHIAQALAREGALRWTVIDSDVLLPHNLARHTLHRLHVGYHKAIGVAHQIRELLGDEGAGTAMVADCLEPRPDQEAALAAAYQAADIILDTSASIAVERRLSDMPGVAARRMSAFFNPAGTSVVLLAEGQDRAVPLREIEAQYYNAILMKPELRGHLTGAPEGFRYSGSCRTLTSRIPERSAAVLSALAADGIRRELESGAGGMRIWSVAAEGSVQLHHFPLVPGTRASISDWSVTVDGNVVARLRAEREKHLPNETGGVLLGIVDFERRAIHVAHALSAPPDSHETEAGFERGIQGLMPEIERACEAVMHQIRYVGEWHSHPRGASARASSTDVKQIAWLSINLRSEGCPAVMLIVGEAGTTVNLGITGEGQAA
jgi:integrative and conjugative element protein (TIGR02256 family)